MENNEWVTGSVTLKLNGEPVEMQMTVPAKPIKPHRMLPIFQKMTSAFVEASIQAAEAAGGSISCKAGCGACCRQPVPMSEAEIHQIAELVESMPEPRRSEIRGRFAAGTAHLREMGWFDEIEDRIEQAQFETREIATAKLADLAMRYFRQGIACPFLENESCSIHESRPLACREYLVTSPAENCSAPSAETIRMVDVFLKPSRSLRNITKTGQLKGIKFLPLIRALDIAESFPEQFAEKTGQEWMSDFFDDVSANQKAEGSHKVG